MRKIPLFKVAASLTVYRVSGMTKEELKDIARWIRERADVIENFPMPFTMKHKSIYLYKSTRKEVIPMAKKKGGKKAKPTTKMPMKMSTSSMKMKMSSKTPCR
jgi:hypothetical protein